MPEGDQRPLNDILRRPPSPARPVPKPWNGKRVRSSCCSEAWNFPKHLQPLAAAIDRLCFHRPLKPWEKEWEERRKARARIVRALRHRDGTPNRQQEAPEA